MQPVHVLHVACCPCVSFKTGVCLPGTVLFWGQRGYALPLQETWGNSMPPSAAAGPCWALPVLEVVRERCLVELCTPPTCSEPGCAIMISLFAAGLVSFLQFCSGPFCASSCRTQFPVALNLGIYSSSGMYFSVLLWLHLQIIVDLCLQVLSCQHFAAAGFLSRNWIALSDISIPA